MLSYTEVCTNIALLCQIVYEKGMAAMFKLPSIPVANVTLLWTLDFVVCVVLSLGVNYLSLP